MTIDDRRFKLNAFFRSCIEKGQDPTHKNIKENFEDETNRVMAEITAVRYHTSLIPAKLGKKRATLIFIEALGKIEKVKYITKYNKQMDKICA